MGWERTDKEETLELTTSRSTVTSAVPVLDLFSLYIYDVRSYA